MDIVSSIRSITGTGDYTVVIGRGTKKRVITAMSRRGADILSLHLDSNKVLHYISHVEIVPVKECHPCIHCTLREGR